MVCEVCRLAWLAQSMECVYTIWPSEWYSFVIHILGDQLLWFFFFYFFFSPGARVFSMSCLNMIAPAISDHDITRNAHLIPISVHNSRQWVVAVVHVRAQMCSCTVAGRALLFQRVQRVPPLWCKYSAVLFQIFLDTRHWVLGSLGSAEQLLRDPWEKCFVHFKFMRSLPCLVATQ